MILKQKQPTCQAIAHVDRTKTCLRTSGCFLIPSFGAGGSYPSPLKLAGG